MSRLLFIEASPREELSFSSRTARAFIDSYQQNNPDDTIDHLPLFEVDLPAFGLEAATQKMANIAQLIATGENIDAVGEWAGVVAEIERFRTADKVLISSAMWNFSIPYVLKHYIDLICQPGLTFGINQKGEYVGMVIGKPIQLILARGSEYPKGFPKANDGTKTDFQYAYLAHIARMLGFKDIRNIVIEPTEAHGKVAAQATLEAKILEAQEAAIDF